MLYVDQRMIWVGLSSVAVKVIGHPGDTRTVSMCIGDHEALPQEALALVWRAGLWVS